jgi:hypothetical protein
MNAPSIKYSLETEWKLHGQIEKLHPLKFAGYDDKNDRDALVFWLAHFRNMKSVPFDHFKLHLEAYC